MSTDHAFLAITIGNSRTRLATFIGDEFQNQADFNTSDTTEIVELALKLWKNLEAESPQIVMAASDEIAGEAISAMLSDQTSTQLWQIGKDIPVAIGQHLDPETITGTDRLLNAAAAWKMSKLATIVVDAGTCVTVDFIDGEGTFHGGAIAPGAQMQLTAMHTGTTALPEVDFDKPLKEAFGKNTAQAMLQGVYQGIRGMVRQLSEQYASRYGAYPRVIATGGNALMLFEDEDLIEQIIPDLQFQGIAISVKHAMSVEEDA
jgi:type III pantothenate kinase